MSEQLIAVGVLSRPHGIKGEIRLIRYTDSIDVFLGEVFLQKSNLLPKKAEIISFRIHQGVALVCFKGFSDRSAVEGLRGQTLFISRSRFPEIESNESYLCDLLGFSVVLDNTGEVIGRLEYVSFPGGQELWSIITPEGKEVFLPAIPEFVLEIDTNAQLIRVNPPKGLLELYK